MDNYRITGMRAADGGARLTLYVTGSNGAGAPDYLTLTVLSSRLPSMPAVGPVDPETVSFLQKEDGVCRAMAYGLRALSAGDVSAAMLIGKMRVRGIPKAAACEATDELAARGYLDEKRAARREAERGVGKLWGDRRILADLSAKGFGQAAMAEAAEFLAGEDGGARCAELIRKKRMTLPEEPRQQQKLFAALARYGYASGEIKAALVAVFGQ